MPGQRLVAFEASVIPVTAWKPESHDIEFGMVMFAAGIGVDTDATHGKPSDLNLGQGYLPASFGLKITRAFESPVLGSRMPVSPSS